MRQRVPNNNQVYTDNIKVSWVLARSTKVSRQWWYLSNLSCNLLRWSANLICSIKIPISSSVKKFAGGRIGGLEQKSCRSASWKSIFIFYKMKAVGVREFFSRIHSSLVTLILNFPASWSPCGNQVLVRIESRNPSVFQLQASKQQTIWAVGCPYLSIIKPF